jgi:hypothetical protein
VDVEAIRRERPLLALFFPRAAAGGYLVVAIVAVLRAHGDDVAVSAKAGAT